MGTVYLWDVEHWLQVDKLADVDTGQESATLSTPTGNDQTSYSLII